MEFSEFKYRIWPLLQSVKISLFKIAEPIAQRQNLTPLQVFLLYSIKHRCISNIGSVCRILAINQSNASTMCKRLEKEGYIMRSRGPDDERVVTLTLTEQGNAVINRLDENFASHQEKLRGIPAEKFDIIIRGFVELDALIKLL